MDADWITSPSARRVLQHAADKRPAWLWSQDGQNLIWQNGAAHLFLAKLKKSGLKRAPAAIPIKGQVSRNIRLGSPGRTSLARIQFQAGDKPTSSTCATTPLVWQDEQLVLLIVGVDPIAPEILLAADEGDAGMAAEEAPEQGRPAETADQADAGTESIGPVAETVEAQMAEPVADTPRFEPSEPAMVVPDAPEDSSALMVDDVVRWNDHEDLAAPEMVEPSDAPVTSVGELIAADENAYARELESWSEAEHDMPPPAEQPADVVTVWDGIEAPAATVDVGQSVEPDAVTALDAEQDFPPQPEQPADAFSVWNEIEAPPATVDVEHTPDHEVATEAEQGAPLQAEQPAEVAGVWDAVEQAPATVVEVGETVEPGVVTVPEAERVDTPLPEQFPDVVDDWNDVEPPLEAGDDTDETLGLDAEAAPGAASGPETMASRLSRLVDRLATNDALYAPLTDADDTLVQAATKSSADLYQVTGRGFVPDEQTDAEVDLPELAALDMPADDGARLVAEPADDEKLRIEAALAQVVPRPADPDVVERVSRYNFDELSRILTDRVGDTSQTPPRSSEPQRSAALINLGGETLVLNRLPLGILVFRDQQVLFANRAITEMVGYESVEKLREAGLASVFPAGGTDGRGAGPVNHLVQRDGTLVPVTARLQSISWQGRPALMLSASTTEVRTGHEAAVNAFAQTLADVRGDGFFEATRLGVISGITQKAASLLGQDGPLEGKPLTGLIATGEVPALREFLERPARFAETARPCLTLRSASGKAEVIIFAQGQAGIVTGYFGFVRGRDTAPVRIASQTDVDPALLGRISRGVRRPLNTIMGFSELLRSGTGDAEKLEGYARDIGTAGQEIAALVDELEDYARLRDGRYLPQRASIELTALLESCVIRIRQQASSARVFVRNAISETLPRVTADRASLAQAVLNLLASAIDQTPTGGAVVISAQREDDGGIAVHVRDSSTNAVDLAERFVVFRDGVGKDGQMLAPVRSSVGLALTRSLLAVNAFSLSVDPAGEQGLLFTLVIPPDLVEKPADVAE